MMAKRQRNSSDSTLDSQTAMNNSLKLPFVMKIFGHEHADQRLSGRNVARAVMLRNIPLWNANQVGKPSSLKMIKI